MMVFHAFQNIYIYIYFFFFAEKKTFRVTVFSQGICLKKVSLPSNLQSCGVIQDE